MWHQFCLDAGDGQYLFGRRRQQQLLVLVAYMVHRLQVPEDESADHHVDEEHQEHADLQRPAHLCRSEPGQRRRGSSRRFLDDDDDDDDDDDGGGGCGGGNVTFIARIRTSRKCAATCQHQAEMFSIHSIWRWSM